MDGDILRSGEGRRLDSLAGDLRAVYGSHGRLSHKAQQWTIAGPVDLCDRVMELGRKGVAIQRYKGLGELNPGQLWETTLDQNVRSRLPFKISHVHQAEDVFSPLMGDLVEHRSDFIQEN